MTRSLEQLDTALGLIEALFADAPIEDAPELSFPIAEKAMNADQYQATMLPSGTGIIDRGGGGGPFRLINPDESTNEMTLTVDSKVGRAEAVINGFGFQMKQDVQVSLPYVSTRTVYHVGLEFDPTRLTTPLGPIRRVVHINTIPTTAGRIYLPLHRVTRQPNQLLQHATVERLTPRVAPVMYVWAEGHKPDPELQLWGTICIVGQTGSMYRSASAGESGTRGWQPVSDTVWVDIDDTSNYVGAPGMRRWQIGRQGKTRRLRGAVARRGGELFNVSNGYHPISLAEMDRPSAPERFPIAVQGGVKPGWLSIDTDGAVRVEVGGNCSWVSLSGVAWDVD